MIDKNLIFILFFIFLSKGNSTHASKCQNGKSHDIQRDLVVGDTLPTLFHKHFVV